MNLNLDPKQMLAVLLRARTTITILIVLGLIGYTGYQISKITAIQPDAAYIKANEKKHKSPNLKINQDVVNELNKLQPAGNAPVPVTTGRDNPFSL